MSVSKNPDACPISILMSLLSGPWTMSVDRKLLRSLKNSSI
ncbi:hypothetical protein [Nostoc sp.]